MEMQKAKCITKFKEGKQRWKGCRSLDMKAYDKAVAIKTLRFWCKNRQTDKWNPRVQKLTLTCKTWYQFNILGRGWSYWIDNVSTESTWKNIYWLPPNKQLQVHFRYKYERWNNKMLGGTIEEHLCNSRTCNSYLNKTKKAVQKRKWKLGNAKIQNGFSPKNITEGAKQ